MTEELKSKYNQVMYMIIGDSGSGKTTFAEKQFPTARIYNGIQSYCNDKHPPLADDLIVFTFRYVSEIPYDLLKHISGWYCFRNADCTIDQDTSKLKVGEYIYLKNINLPKVIILVGEAASGKSTFAHEILKSTCCCDIDSVTPTLGFLFKFHEIVLMVRSVKEIPLHLIPFIVKFYCFRNSDMPNDYALDTSKFKTGDFICVRMK